ncbi:MAG TPA: phospholipase D-like domain-containing protein [Roseiflexaceae bacterium]|nr:phospholipase D-like domain-containing protein [Roseiflexaceae bacterium]
MRRRRSRGPRNAPFKWLAILLLIVLVGYVAYRELGFGVKVDSGTQGPVIRIDVPTVELSLPSSVAIQATQPPARAQPTVPPGPAGAPAPAPSQAPGGWYDIYFTTPRYPDKPEYHHGGIDTQLVAFINSAQKTLDIAIYDFDLENVANALAQAAARGVRVRMVTDTDTLTNDDPKVQRAFDILKQANIPIVDDQRPAIMHDKFVVVDNQAIWTGSWNFTDGDTYHLNNNAIKIVSPELAHNYTAEFEKMFVQRRFGPAKPAGGTEANVTLHSVRIENYFAPKDKVAAKIVARVEQAQQSIHFLAFSFTSDTIGQSIIARAKAGVSVMGVFEKTGSETQYSEYGKMRRAKLDVLQDGNPYVKHHKVIIIDGRTVIFGSFNFTNNADRDNDENLLIVDDPTLANAFEAEFQRVREVALNPPTK